jgi:hypothetical protein
MPVQFVPDIEPLQHPRETTIARVARCLGFGLVVVAAMLVGLVLLAGVAHGQEPGAVAGPELDVLGLLRAFVGAIQTGQWPVAVVLGLVVAVYVLKKVGGRWIPWLATSEGGTVLALATATASTLGAAALGGVPITWALAWKAAAAGFAAIGGYVGARRVLRALSPLVAKIPTVGPLLAKALDFLSGASAKDEIAAQTSATYKPLSPAPDAQAAADALSKPPVP